MKKYNLTKEEKTVVDEFCKYSIPFIFKSGEYCGYLQYFELINFEICPALLEGNRIDEKVYRMVVLQGVDIAKDKLDNYALEFLSLYLHVENLVKKYYHFFAIVRFYWSAKCQTVTAGGACPAGNIFLVPLDSRWCFIYNTVTAVVYDLLGNPTTYRGKALTFTRCHLVSSFDGTAFSYDGDGNRVKKTPQNGTATEYFYADGTLYKEKFGVDTILYYRDEDGKICSIMYDSAPYILRKNAQGDVIALCDSNGAVVARYVYDAWGNHKVLNPDGTENTSAGFIGNINPIRYRGYYFDKDLGLYWLKTRFYDPQTGRFISPDSVEYLDPETLGGINLYAYCNNNPVMNVDPDGTMPKWLKWTLIGVAVVSAAVVAAVTMGPGVLLDGAVGAIVGIGLEFFGDLLDDGKINRGWGAYIGAGLGGFVAGLGQGLLSTVFFSGVGDVVDGVVSGTITSFNAGISAFG